MGEERLFLGGLCLLEGHALSVDEPGRLLVQCVFKITLVAVVCIDFLLRDAGSKVRATVSNSCRTRPPCAQTQATGHKSMCGVTCRRMIISSRSLRRAVSAIMMSLCLSSSCLYLKGTRVRLVESEENHECAPLCHFVVRRTGRSEPCPPSPPASPSRAPPAA